MIEVADRFKVARSRNVTKQDVILIMRNNTGGMDYFIDKLEWDKIKSEIDYMFETFEWSGEFEFIITNITTDRCIDGETQIKFMRTPIHKYEEIAYSITLNNIELNNKELLKEKMISEYKKYHELNNNTKHRLDVGSII